MSHSAWHKKLSPRIIGDFPGHQGSLRQRRLSPEGKTLRKSDAIDTRAFPVLALTNARALNLYLHASDGNRFSENRCFNRQSRAGVTSRLVIALHFVN
jgi:hypothetical protein